MARYKWDSPAEWLVQRRQAELNAAESDGTHSALQAFIANLWADFQTVVSHLDSDTIQDDFQSEMAQDGYFRNLDAIINLRREQCVALLEGISIECRDEETVEELRAAVESNVEDGTLAWEDIENA